MQSNRMTEYSYLSTVETRQIRSSTPQHRLPASQISEPLLESNSRKSLRSSEVFSQGQQEVRMRRSDNMVIQFLMSVEIERLKNENDKLKFRIKEIDDKKFTIQNYEQQIEDLKGRLIEMDEIVETYSYEKQELITKTSYLEQEIREQKEIQVHKYNKQIDDLLNEIETLRIKLRDFESQKLNEMQVIRDQLEYEMKLQIEKHNQERDLNQQYQREFLEGELKKWKDMSNQKQRENDDLRSALQQRDLSKQRELEQQLDSYKNEVNRINRQLISKQEENEQWKSKYLQLTQINDDYERLEKENQTLRQSCYDLEISYKGNQGQVDNLKQELEKLRYALQIKSNELEEQKTKSIRNEKLTSDYLKEKRQIEQKIELMQQEIDRLQFIIRQKTTEYENLQKKHIEFEKLIEQIQTEKRMFQDYQQKLRDSEKKNQDLENRYRNLLTEVDKLNKDKKDRDSIIYSQTTKIEQYESSYQTSIIQLEDRNNEIAQLKEQIKQLQIRIQQLLKYEENIRVLSQEIDRQNDILHQQEQELKQWRLQYADEGSLVHKINDQLTLIVVLIAELESLRVRLVEKDDEIEEVRRSSLAQYKM